MKWFIFGVVFIPILTWVRRVVGRANCKCEFPEWGPSKLEWNECADSYDVVCIHGCRFVRDERGVDVYTVTPAWLWRMLVLAYREWQQTHIRSTTSFSFRIPFTAVNVVSNSFRQAMLSSGDSRKRRIVDLFTWTPLTNRLWIARRKEL